MCLLKYFPMYENTGNFLRKRTQFVMLFDINEAPGAVKPLATADVARPRGALLKILIYKVIRNSGIKLKGAYSTHHCD